MSLCGTLAAIDDKSENSSKRETQKYRSERKFRINSTSSSGETRDFILKTGPLCQKSKAFSKTKRTKPVHYLTSNVSLI